MSKDEKKKELDKEFEVASEEVFQQTLMTLRLLQKEISDTNWMFENFES